MQVTSVASRGAFLLLGLMPSLVAKKSRVGAKGWELSHDLPLRRARLSGPSQASSAQDTGTNFIWNCDRERVGGCFFCVAQNELMREHWRKLHARESIFAFFSGPLLVGDDAAHFGRITLQKIT
jgi:hypothetical protein